MERHRTTGPARPDFDLTYRPDYWRPSDPISVIIANVKGEVRRRQILDVLEGRHQLLAKGAELPEELLADELSEDERAALGGVHPALMGGEYLPGYDRGEIEIARIVLASTTMDVVSVRAHRKRYGIHYRVVDEYETRFAHHPQASRAPLTLGEIISLLDSIREQGEPPGPEFITGVRDFNYSFSRRHPECYAHFATVHSPFYRQLCAFYHWRGEQWLAAERARIAALEGDGSDQADAGSGETPAAGEEAAG